MRVLITGADGFIGRHLQTAFSGRGISFRSAVRRSKPGGPAEACAIGNIGPMTDWRHALAGIDIVVHLAGKAHVLRKASPDLFEEFMLVNAEGTGALLRACAEVGISRFVYLSSVGVLGGSTPDTSFTNASQPRPANTYATSKLAGEISVKSFADRLQVVVVRPPLVYGPHVKANFLRLLRLVDSGIPLPLASVRNRRSFISIWNLCDFLIHVLDSPVAVGGSWLVSDDYDISTPELLAEIGAAMGKRTRVWPFPPGALEILASLVGARTAIRQLCGSLVLDIEETRRQLGWSPPLSFAEGIQRTVDWYVDEGRAARHVSASN